MFKSGMGFSGDFQDKVTRFAVHMGFDLIDKFGFNTVILTGFDFNFKMALFMNEPKENHELLEVHICDDLTNY